MIYRAIVPGARARARAHARLNEKYGLSREILFMKAYLGEMMLIPISDINLDARGINISRGCVAIL